MRPALCLLALLAAPSLAQAPAPHALPFPSGPAVRHAVELAVELAVANATLGEPLTVHVAEAPPWLRFEAAPSRAAPSRGAEATARLAFSVSPDAPVGEPATVELVVTGGGAERARHAFSVVVEPPAVSLSAPVPNPSRAGAEVSFTTSGAGPARLSVVDMLGREVAVLAEGTLAPGPRAVSLPRLASGVYVVRLVTHDGTRTERFTVAR